MVELKSVRVNIPHECNVIIGQSHFIKTVEDIHEAMVNTVPGAKFGVAFSEASGPCLVRYSGTDDDLIEAARQTSLEIGAGHTFVLFLRDCFPVNVLQTLRTVPEICGIFAATANPLEVIVAQSEQGRGIMGVIDGKSPKGIESEEDIKQRKEFLRNIGYKM